MERSVQERLASLEDAALGFEGAIYALHDLIAHWLALAPEAEVRRTVSKLKSGAEELNPSLGPQRIAGYRQELASIEQEIEYAREVPTGILARFRRS